MSGLKQEVQWSPIHPNQFIAWGSEIYLYETVPADKVDGPHLTLSHSMSAQLLATNSAHHYLKCIDIYPKHERDTLLAVGQANGKVSLSTFGSTIYDSKGLAGLEFAPKHSRQCNSLKWNQRDNGLLAAGFERYRSDHGVLVWDVELFDSQSPRSEVGLSDTAHSLCWLPSIHQALAVGFNNKTIKIIDLKESTKVVSSCQTKAVYGLSVCPDNENHLASYFEHQLAIWDLRNFDRPLIAVQKNKPISKLSWCPTRKNLLGIVLKESSSIQIVDVQTQSEDSGRDESSVIERSVKPGLPHTISSFSWHPSHHNRLLAVSVHGGLVDYLVSERMTVSWGSGSAITWTSDSKTLEIVSLQDEFFDSVGDMSISMKKRAVNKYGLLPFLKDNAELVDSKEVKGLWTWLEHSENLVNERVIESSSSRHPGIRSIIGIDPSSGSQNSLLHSQIVYLPWSSLNSSSAARVYQSPVRDKALKLCGWDFVYDSNELSLVAEKLVSQGQTMKAVAYCVFGLQLKNAIQILAKSSGHSTIAMALSGFTSEKTSVWRESCLVSSKQLVDPYLRMVFSFLTSDAETYDQVFVETGVEVADRVGFALTFLSDNYLLDYIEQLTESLVVQGDLSGILLTGMSVEAIPLLQQYINLTSDIQTAALVCVRALPQELFDHDRIQYWISSYREILDCLRLWECRAEFDIATCSASGFKPPPQVTVVCNFCGRSITSASPPPQTGTSSISRTAATTAAGKQYARHRISSNQTKVTCCPHCRKPQPRCSICLTNMGSGSLFEPGLPPQPPPLPPPASSSALTTSAISTSSSSGCSSINPFDSWYTWCQTCRHGGHVNHITSWFREHMECPVTGCTCNCMSLDPIGSIAAVT